MSEEKCVKGFARVLITAYQGDNMTKEYLDHAAFIVISTTDMKDLSLPAFGKIKSLIGDDDDESDACSESSPSLKPAMIYLLSGMICDWLSVKYNVKQTK